jgi:hypothetical protein
MLFNQRKNKSFTYKSRFSGDANSDGNQATPDENVGFVSKWKQEGRVTRKARGGFSIKILLLVLVLLLICMYILDKKYM